MSRITAPVGEVTMPIRCGSAGSGRFRAASNSPSAASFFFNCSKASCSAPCPCGSMRLHDELHFAARFINIDPPARQHRDRRPAA